ncbi:MAG: STAS domain-containing protein [Gammaproteobacteria bacterium]|nr:STAS domain-containing protein [Gammaproteobacteria bacterium]
MIKEMLINRFLPFLAWLPELKDGKILRADLMAGITVALVLIPQSMAYAQLAGLPPYYGLYAAFMPPMVAALFGSSRQLATGPVAVVSLMTAAALEPLATAGGGAYIAYAILLTLMVGAFQLSLGLLRLGVLVNFLSHPVVVGFTNAAAIIIATSQLSKLFGVTVEKMPHHYETVWNVILAAIEYTHLPTLAMGVLAFSIMIALKRWTPKLPNVLIAVAVTTVIAWATDFQKLETARIERINAVEVRDAIGRHEQIKQSIRELSDRIIAADLALAETRKKHGPNSREVLETEYNVQDLRLQRGKVQHEAKGNLKQLQSQALFSTIGTEGERTFHATAPEGAEESVWHISKLTPEGDVVMHSGGKVVGSIPAGLPAFKIPVFDWGIILHLLAAAITISIIGFMEAISVAKAMAAKTRQRLDANQELVGQGIGNIIGGLFQSYPSSGSFSRSAVNINAGAITGFSSVVTTLVVIITLLFLTPLLYNLPQATLAAVIMMAVFGLVNIQAIKHAWHACKHDGVVSVITFVLTLAVAPHLDKGLMVGVGLSLVLYLYRTMKPRVVYMFSDRKGVIGREIDRGDTEACEEIGIIRFEGSLYFANISYFEDKVQELLADKPRMKFLIVQCVRINGVDASGEGMLCEVVQRLRDVGIEVLFSRVKEPIQQMLEHTGFVELAGKERFFRRPEHALRYISDKMGPEFARDWPLKRES